jgi:hypothetical protein
MSHFLDWRDYSRQAHIKQLIESKGLEFVRQQFLKESNKMLWDDPIIITETTAVGQSLTNNNSAAVGSSPSLIGRISEVQRFTWNSGIANTITGSNHPLSASIHEYYFDVTAYNGTVDYSQDHVNSYKTFRFLVISGSTGYTYSNTTGLSGLVTASYTRTDTASITGSLLNKFKDAIATQAASATVAGFTNTIAPSALFTATLANLSSSLTITHVHEGGVPDISTTFTSTTASVSVITNGLDSYYNSTNTYNYAPLIDGAMSPYTTLTRKG